METKRNLKYFTTKGLSPLSIVGLAIIVAGFIVSGIIRDMGVMLVLIGIGFLVFSASASAKETDIDYQVSEKIKDLEEQAMIKYEVYEKDFLTIVNPAKLFGYDYIGEEVHFKHGADGKNRTSVYNGIQLFYTEDKLYIHGRRFSLINDLDDTEFGGAYSYLDLDRADYETREKPLPKDRKVTYQVFLIYANDGKPVCEVSVSYGADVDKTIEEINHVINLKKRDAGVLKA